MGLFTIAKKNLKNNFSFYSFYFISVAFVLMVFFSFISFSMNDIVMEKISSDGRVETMAKTVAIFVMAFVLFYMSYSNTFFMKKRMNELGIYSLLGYRKSTMLKLLTFENIIICFVALLVGIIFGAIAHKGIVGVIIKILKLQIDTSKVPFINLDAVLFTFAFIFAVLFVLSLSNWIILRKSSLLTLVRMEQKAENKGKINATFSLLGLFFILIGYFLALDITRGMQSLWKTIGFSPIALLTMFSVILGTIFFIHSFLPYAIQKLKKHKMWFYKESNIIVIPNFIFKIRSKAKTLILLTLLTAGTLAIFSSTLLTLYYPVAATERIVPSAIEFPLEDKEVANTSLQTVQKTVGKESINYTETTIINVKSNSDSLPKEYSIKKEHGFDLISESDYRELIHVQDKNVEFNHLAKDESILVKYRPEKEDLDKGKIYTLNVTPTTNIDVKVKDTTLLNPIGFANSVGTLIISDQLYKEIKTLELPQKTIVSFNGKDMRNNKAIYENLAPLFKNNMYFTSSYQKNDYIIQQNSSTFLLISFVTIIFFIATGSILYFHNLSSMMSNKNEFIILNRMGYNKKKIKRIISKEIFTLFSIPYIIGLAHSIFALVAYKTALMDDLLGKSSALILPILFAVIIFTVVYTVYYLLTKRACYKIIFSNKKES
ncbi:MULTISPECIES: FtsX-like permease family protein [Bacillus cereus group]|uniref:FtsX-like permease family protein n=1 Tax=Bacillus cereus group TaxID=86661 RepID=UPI000942D63A|nr:MULTISPECIES: ABC transporter permease [Bacillus cereus group]PEB07346.1 ABC transporter permease [Bacillus cereus]MCZ7521593.1 ABC transporter permease [Bacillus pacificus]MDA1573051.1 ABC transporter permease [Bacillus cereus group sp. TH242-3LC]MED1586896.1 ABC transporter permease [Bacillus pacificus]RRB00516.1 ABC transporter permease [Bacillus pacificus]